MIYIFPWRADHRAKSNLNFSLALFHNGKYGISCSRLYFILLFFFLFFPSFIFRLSPHEYLYYQGSLLFSSSAFEAILRVCLPTVNELLFSLSLSACHSNYAIDYHHPRLPKHRFLPPLPFKGFHLSTLCYITFSFFPTFF
jgi:hypothetical protein